MRVREAREDGRNRKDERRRQVGWHGKDSERGHQLKGHWPGDRETGIECDAAASCRVQSAECRVRVQTTDRITHISEKARGGTRKRIKRRKEKIRCPQHYRIIRQGHQPLAGEGGY
jgi:hypothetical protein